MQFDGTDSVADLLREKGQMPVPPYIKRSDYSHSSIDRQRYQTVYSRREGAVAAPTAGLHFTEELLEKLEKRGIRVVSVTLHVGYGTFQPVRTADIRDHKLGAEYFKVEDHAARMIRECRASGKRVIAVGTTAVRALETTALAKGTVEPGEGMTDLMVTPGFSFRVVDGLITNFHLPKSSLLFLVAAFVGLDAIREAYASAIEKKYRFYSYGDAMLIL
jgi:S-adenosylmethionine:tRNA ribosyltransferase-isomerase